MSLPKDKIKILGISGSLKNTSSNSALTRAIGKLMPGSVEYTICDLIGNLPHFSPDIDGENSPKAVTDFRRQLKQSSGVIICTPEYAFNLPGVLKNALDWTVSSGDFYKKPSAVISASPLPTGGDKAHYSVMMTMTAMQAIVTDGSKLMVGSINKKLNGDEITDEDLREKLVKVIDELLRVIEENPKINL